MSPKPNFIALAGGPSIIIGNAPGSG